MAKKIRNVMRALGNAFVADVAAPPAYTAEVASVEQGNVQSEDTQEQPTDTTDTSLPMGENGNSLDDAEAADTQEQSNDSNDNVQSDDTQDAPTEPRILEDVSKQDVSDESSDTQSEDKQDAPTDAAPVAVAAPKLTKKLQVRNLIAATPASIATIATHMGISNIAAQSLIGDLKRDKVQVVSKKVDKVTLYTVAA